MTLDKARKILGEFGDKLTEQELQMILDCLAILIEAGFQVFEKLSVSSPTTRRQHYKP